MVDPSGDPFQLLSLLGREIDAEMGMFKDIIVSASQNDQALEEFGAPTLLGCVVPRIGHEIGKIDQAFVQDRIGILDDLVVLGVVVVEFVQQDTSTL